MVNWDYDASQVEEMDFKPIPAGDHRVRIEQAEEKKPSSGNDMIELVLSVSGYNSKVWYYMVFMKDNTKLTNSKLAQIFDSFDIPIGCMDITRWVGKVGAARIKHEAYNGEQQAKVSYFLGRAKKDALPPWQEPSGTASVTGGGTATTTGTTAGFTPVSDEDIPF